MKLKKALPMPHIPDIKYYSPLEERLNIITHAIGIVFGITGLVLLIIHSILNGNAWHIVSFSIFGASLVILYSASTSYHMAQSPKLRSRLRINDHASIYVLIAGTYTPFTLVTLSGPLGWTIFGLSWGFAITGIFLKIFFTGKYNIISTVLYVLMGWAIVFAIKPLIHNLSTSGLFWLFTGGIAYTIGAVLYGIKKIKFNHTIFHVFVLLGSISHFISVYFYVLD
jgi:hemolysin III